MAHTAVLNLKGDWKPRGSDPFQHKNEQKSKLVEFFQIRWRFLVFESILFMSTLGFYTARLSQWLRLKIFGVKSMGFESLTDLAMKKAIEEQFGLSIDDSIMDG